MFINLKLNQLKSFVYKMEEDLTGAHLRYLLILTVKIKE